MVERYLRERFLDAPAFAARCGIDEPTLSRLIASGLAPGASYEVDDAGTMRSLVFGAVPSPGAPMGQWFNPSMAPWVARGHDSLAAHDGDVAVAAASLQARFREGYRVALQAVHAEEGSIPGFADAQGRFDDAAFDTQFPSLWQHLLAGTYGLCVAHPLDEAHIAAKETVQARLTQLTDNGSRRDFSDAERTAVRGLIARYQAVSMPFSPAEYHRSSRKRLVDDLLPHVTTPDTRSQ
ncbi:DUF6058 family natural product biosynthesis protein [Lysobacter sp. LF1]|uniref:DUF6058 family natural product biosynthesis protein n=1 Tax=Lysobacter stagni TaxID=3045172 RepID=A0ABT6XH83_9GAMM|nr:DUF6058 family natural product biosynthesis protein [Lysobacter sp. LF1]MDI9239517.1 DUF6058 family natural product biosynthesis protein [Lysobacter sp. LF1]